MLILAMPMHTTYSPLTVLFRIAALACLLLVLLSCGTRDDRNDIRAQRGDPNEIQTLGSDPFWRELWFYNQAGTGYEFRRTAACGSSREVYLYQIFSFVPIADSTATAHPNQRTTPPNIESHDAPLSPH